MDPEDDENMEGDSRIQNLAAEIADASDPLVPRLLLKLTGEMFTCQNMFLLQQNNLQTH